MKNKKTSIEKCALSGEILDREKLIKFVISPDNDLIADIFDKIDVSGIFIKAEKKSVKKAIEEGLFAKLFNKDIKISNDIVEQIEKGLKTQISGMISLANKSGNLIRGFDKIKMAVKKNKIEFMISAKDGSKAGKDKIKTNEIKQFEIFIIDELNRILAKENVVHIALVKSKIATNLRKLIEKLDFFED